jgi:hypothetical protein
MDAKTVALLGGLLFLLLAIVGGGFSIREINMPSIPGWARVACLFVGVGLVVPWILTEVGSDQEESRPAAVSGRFTSSTAEGVIHEDGESYVSPHGIEVSGLLATGKHNSPAVGDRILIQFSFKNVGSDLVTFIETFVGVRSPDGKNEDFGHENEGLVFEPGSAVDINQSVLVDQAGTWEFWPCYTLKVGGEDTFCPDEWRAFEVLVV